MTAEKPSPQPNDTAERIFAATGAALTAQAQAALGGAEPVVAAAAFWPNGVTKSTMEDGTVGGKKMGAIFGPNLGAITRVHIKRRGMSRIVILDDDAAGNHLRLHASVAPYMARSGPQKLVMAELARTAA